MLRATLLVAAIAGCSRASPAPAQSSSASTAMPAASGLPLGAHADVPHDSGREVDRWCVRHGHACVVYVPTPQKIVDQMLAVANLQANDVLYDLGCGDGRIVVTAAKEYGVHAVGFDIDPDRVSEARENVRRAGVENLATIEQRDVFKVDLSPASVVTVYLLPRLNVRLVPQLEKLSAGTRIISHDFDIEGAIPAGTWWTTASYFGRRNELYDASAPEDEAHYEQVEHKVYLWVTPLKWEGEADR